MPQVVRCHRDSSLKATLSAGKPLRYQEGADTGEDRPAHVRAGSGLAWLGGRLAVIQDDALFVALIDPKAQQVSALSLPTGDGGRRQFDDGRGNKHLKLDLEACTVIPWAGGEALLAVGSGSSGRRETLALVDPEAAVWLFHVPELYARLRAATAFSGSELNVEGAVLADGRLRLFNRGNGAPRGDLRPVNASCELDLQAFVAFLQDPAGVPPAIGSIRQYDLGQLEGCGLSFTDVARMPEGLLFTASAEASPDAVRDGQVLGSAIGVLGEADGRWIELRTADGALFPHKVEGLCPGARPGHGYAVVDVDDPERPSELYEVELTGPW